jgi:2'-5' RNA ligase
MGVRLFQTMAAPGTVRAFIALDLPETIKQAAARIQGILANSGGDVRWVKASGLHLTLKFLGPVPTEKIPEIIEALESVTAPAHPFRITVKGIGAFPHIGNPRVIWLGLESGPELAEFHAAVEKAMTRLGFEPEGRSFQPHLTLGRVRSPRGREKLRAALEPHEEGERPACELKEIALMKSELRSGGAEYTALWSKVLS